MFIFPKACTAVGAALMVATWCTSAQAAPITLTPDTSISVPSPYVLDVTNHITLNASASTGALAFSNPDFDGVDPTTNSGFVNFLSTVGAKVSAIGGNYTPAFVPAPPYGEAVLVGAAVNGLKVVRVTLDNQTGQLSSFAVEGGFELSTSANRGISTGGLARIENLRFDLTNKQILADLSGAKAATATTNAVTYSLPDTVMWTFGASAGPAALPVFERNGVDELLQLRAQGYEISTPSYASGQRTYTATALNTFSGLAVTDAGQNFLEGALGLSANAKTLLDRVKPNHGTFTAQLSYTVGVPEPQTSLLMGLGLSLMAGVVRRRGRPAT